MGKFSSKRKQPRPKRHIRRCPLCLQSISKPHTGQACGAAANNSSVR